MCFVGVWLVLLGLVWGIATIPVFRRRFAAANALALVLWPLAPYILYSIAQLER